MEKSIVKYLIATLLLVVFTCFTILPGFISRQEEQNHYSIDKEKTEKENREKDSSVENVSNDYLSVIHGLNQNNEIFYSSIVEYVNSDISFIQTCYLPVLTPPPDQI